MKQPGTINGFIATRGEVNGQRFTFNGTTVDLAVQAHAAGGRVGDTVLAYWFTDPDVYVLTPAPAIDTRVPGVWPDRVFKAGAA